MQSTKTKPQAKTIARPLAHLLHPATEPQPMTHVSSHLPKVDTSVSKEVVNVAVTGYN